MYVYKTVNCNFEYIIGGPYATTFGTLFYLCQKSELRTVKYGGPIVALRLKVHIYKLSISMFEVLYEYITVYIYIIYYNI